MENGEQSGSGGRTDWRVRLATSVGAIVGASLGLLLRPTLHGFWPALQGFWLGLIAFGAACGVGGVLGRIAGSLLFRSPPGK